MSEIFRTMIDKVLLWAEGFTEGSDQGVIYVRSGGVDERALCMDEHERCAQPSSGCGCDICGLQGIPGKVNAAEDGPGLV